MISAAVRKDSMTGICEVYQSNSFTTQCELLLLSLEKTVKYVQSQQLTLDLFHTFF